MSERYIMKQMVVGPIGTNCFILEDTEAKVCALVDPGDEPDRIRKLLEKDGMDLRYILLTHGHFDHIIGVNDLKDAWPEAEIVIGKKEEPMVNDLSLNSGVGNYDVKIHPDRYVTEGELISFSGLELRVLETPGHTAGSICFYLKDADILFAGDTIFRNSYGRTDLPTGSQRELMISLHRLLTGLPGETTVLPGHGPATTVEHERMVEGF